MSKESSTDKVDFIVITCDLVQVCRLWKGKEGTVDYHPILPVQFRCEHVLDEIQASHKLLQLVREYCFVLIVLLGVHISFSLSNISSS